MIIYPINHLIGTAFAMDKVKIIQSLSNSSYFPLLSRDELKLYILLLVNARAFDEEEGLGFGCVTRALGRDITPDELKRLGERLERFNLASISPWVGGVFKFKIKEMHGQ
jgi:hypothetical protein